MASDNDATTFIECDVYLFSMDCTISYGASVFEEESMTKVVVLCVCGYVPRLVLHRFWRILFLANTFGLYIDSFYYGSVYDPKQYLRIWRKGSDLVGCLPK